jgi:hypothetical protein
MHNERATDEIMIPDEIQACAETHTTDKTNVRKGDEERL